MYKKTVAMYNRPLLCIADRCYVRAQFRCAMYNRPLLCMVDRFCVKFLISSVISRVISWIMYS